MHNEAYSNALKNALTEIKNICPDVQTSFLFDKEGTIIAGDDGTQEYNLEKAVNSMEGIFEKAETIGGLDALIINGQKGRVHISCVNDMYLAMVTSEKADMTYLQTVSRVLIPTVIKLLDNIDPTPFKFAPQSKPPMLSSSRSVDEEEEMEEEETIEEEITRPERPEPVPIKSIPEPSNQLIVDTLSGLLVRGDTVEIDPQVLEQWSENYDDIEIRNVEIETFNGNTTQCKVKPIKDSKLEGKGLIRIPEKVCQALDLRKGELVKVSPMIEEE